MDNKILAVIAVVVVAAAVAGGAYYFLSDDDDAVEKLIKKSDYTLLDKDENIKTGMVVETVYAGSGSGNVVTKVTEVKDGMVTYAQKADVTATTKGPVNEVDMFNYAALQSLKAQADASGGKCTVTVDGLQYTIKGELGAGKEKTTFDLVVILDKNEAGGVPTNVSGKYTMLINNITMGLEFSTAEGVATSKMIFKGEETEVCDVDLFYQLAINDTYTPSGSEETIKFGNVDAVTYTKTDKDSTRTYVGYGNYCLKNVDVRYGLTLTHVHGIYLS